MVAVYMFVVGASIALNVVAAIALLLPFGAAAEKATSVATECSHVKLEALTALMERTTKEQERMYGLVKQMIELQHQQLRLRVDQEVSSIGDRRKPEGLVGRGNLDGSGADAHAREEVQVAPNVSLPTSLPDTIVLSERMSIKWDGTDGMVYLTIPKEELDYGFAAFTLHDKHFHPSTVPDGAYGAKGYADNTHESRLLFLNMLVSHPANADILAPVLEHLHEDGTLDIGAWNHMLYGDITIPLAYVDMDRILDLQAQFEELEPGEYLSNIHALFA